LKRGHVIDLGCKVADVHHRYHEIHSALFGAASFHLIIDALRGRRRRAYNEFTQTLDRLRDELTELETQTQDLAQGDPGKATDHELQHVLLEYTQALNQAAAGLKTIFTGLEHDEAAYRQVGPDGRSGFTRDKLHYDHLLLALERLGTRLNKLFSNY
jgi:hypothetical protein